MDLTPLIDCELRVIPLTFGHELLAEGSIPLVPVSMVCKLRPASHPASSYFPNHRATPTSSFVGARVLNGTLNCRICSSFGFPCHYRVLISDVENTPRFEGRSLDDARAHFDRVLERRDSLARSRGVAGGGVGQGNAIGGGSSRVRNGRVFSGGRDNQGT